MKRIWILIPLFLFITAAAFEADTYGHGLKGEDEEVKRGGAWLGVKLKSVEKIIDGKVDRIEGALVAEVIDDSPADSAGIEAGDIIIALNNVTIEDAEDLVEALTEADAGEMAKVTLLHDGDQKTIDVRLGERKKRVFAVRKHIRKPRVFNVPSPPRAPHMRWHQRGTYGFHLETLNDQLASYFGAPDGKGVLIEKVQEDSDAEKAGFKAGDVILRAGKKTVEDVSDFKHVLRAYDAGETIPVQILRKGKNMTIELEAKEMDEEHEIIMQQFGDDMEFEFEGDDEDVIMHLKGLKDLKELKGLAGLSALKALEGADFDMNIDIDLEDMQEGMREMRIMLNGKELELEELQEELREEIEELRENMEVEVTEDEEGGVRIRARKI